MSFLPPSLSSIFLHYPEAFYPRTFGSVLLPYKGFLPGFFLFLGELLGFFRVFLLRFFFSCAASVSASSLLFLHSGSRCGATWHDRAPWAGNPPPKEGLPPRDPVQLQLRVLGKLGFRKDDYPTMPLTLLNCTTTYPDDSTHPSSLNTTHASMTHPYPLYNFFSQHSSPSTTVN